MKTTWNLAEAAELAQKLEPLAVAACRAHVALAGGVLTKGGERKDLDIVFYPHTTTEGMSGTAITTVLGIVGVHSVGDLEEMRHTRKYGKDRKFFGHFRTKQGKRVDVFVMTGYTEQAS